MALHLSCGLHSVPEEDGRELHPLSLIGSHQPHGQRPEHLTDAVSDDHADREGIVLW